VAQLQVIQAGTVPYEQAWERQREIHAEVVAGTAPDTVLLLEHPAVYTAGRRTEPHERPWSGGTPGNEGVAAGGGTPVIDVDRGGKITWHGPGQIVGYPIVRLPDPVDVVAYVRRMELMLIAVCAELGVQAVQVEGRSGIWLPAEPGRPERKLGQIGIRVSQGVTMHGFALNCDCDLSWAKVIVPCGIADAGVTSLSAELGRDVPVAEVLPIVERHLPELMHAGLAVTA
jgi:lipoyl(octanoyl) transferase